MNTIKRALGIVWFLMGPFSIWYLIRTAVREIAAKPVMDTKIQWGIFIFVFVPISIGLMIFGYYAMKGEYDRLPENSDEI